MNLNSTEHESLILKLIALGGVLLWGGVIVSGVCWADYEWADTRPPARNAQNPTPKDSTAFSSVVLTGVGNSLWNSQPGDYIAADTFYLQWARNDLMYTSVTDGTLTVDGVTIKPHGFEANGYYENGHVQFRCTSTLADGRCNPLTMKAQLPPGPAGQRGLFSSKALTAGQEVLGRYPAANLVVGPGPGGQDIWFYSTYALSDKTGACGSNVDSGWCALGAMFGFRYSMDGGQTWSAEPQTPLFHTSLTARPKFGAAHFVDMGKNAGLDASGNVVTGDGYAYLVSGGTDQPNDASNWVHSKAVYMARVRLADLRSDPALINDLSKWQVWNGSGWSAAQPDVAAAQPIATYDSDGSYTMMGNAAVTYNKPLRKFFMVISRSSDGRDTTHRSSSLTDLTKDFFNLMILEADAVTGPYKLVTYLRNFGPQAYFANIPSRFISADGKSFYLLYSANYVNVLGSQPLTPGYAGYAPVFTEMKLASDGLGGTLTEVDDSQLTYSGSWTAESCAPIPSYMPINRVYQKTCRWSTDASGASWASHSFTGSFIKIYGIADPYHGRARIEIDGAPAGEANFSDPVRHHKLVFEKSGLSAGSHTLKIIPTGGYTVLDKLKYTASGPLRVNAGGSRYVDARGDEWKSDEGFSAGSWTVSFPTIVQGTADTSLYQSVRASMGPLTHTAAVPNGAYAVRLKFAEQYFKSPGQRLFDIRINGSLQSARFDIYQCAGGADRPCDAQFNVSVVDGRMITELVPILSSPTLSAIEILPAGSAAGGAPLVTQFTPGLTRNNFDGSLGMKFTLTSGSVVRGLSRYFISTNNRASGSHVVKILKASDRSLVAAVTVTGNGTTGWRHAALPSSVTLSAGVPYYLLSEEKSGQDDWYDATAVSLSGATSNGAVYCWAQNSCQEWGSGQSYVPVSFNR